MLYHLIFEILREKRNRFYKKHAVLCADGVCDETDLINDFFMYKVMLAVPVGANSYVHVESLCRFYKNFLIDKIRAKERRPVTTSIDLVPEDTPQCFKSASPPLDSPEDAIIRAAARQFLENEEEWVRLYLGLHYCPDRDDAITLFALGKRYQVASYHPKAQKLGITREKSKIGDYAAYRNTMIGGWLSFLGIEINEDHMEEIQHALEILCEQALLMWKEPGLDR